ncbi:LamG-like jellyroll fold domain-containing protein [Nonomuraea sp. NPDC050556]|uniref:LamG-like jellyroll fold domain-containing protein n=1 Tax=Nonomuraea sp. NPDC050556 TaxID=3364369 RepID=UPI0037AB7479
MRQALVVVLAVVLLAGTAQPVSAEPYQHDPVKAGEVAADGEALARARESGQRVEVLSRRGETREVFATPTGAFELIEHLRPVRARRNGAWVDVDATLRANPDGSLSPVASTVALRLGAGGGESLATMGRAGRELGLSWPTPLPAPVVSGDTATYPEVLPGVDLRVRADVDGFSHVLVVRDAQAARNPALRKLELGVTARGLSVRGDADGVLRARDTASGGEVFEAPSPLMWDTPAANPGKAGESRAIAPEAAEGRAPTPGAKVVPLRVTADKGKLTIEPDQAMLAAANYPVYIDPVWKTVNRSARLMVSSGYPTTSYYNFSDTEGVGYCEVSKDGRCVKNQAKRLFYRMPINELAGKYVISAEFTAYETWAYDCNNSTSIQLWHASGFGSTSTWNTTSDNWIKHLTSRDVAYCSRTPVEFGGTALRDVVQAATDRKDPAITLGLRAYSESSMTWWKRFANDAYLRVQYNTPPSQPKMKELSMSPGGPCVDWNAPPAVNRLPVMYAILRDADAGSADKIQGQFKIGWDTGSWTSPMTAAKTTGSTFQVTAPSSLPANKAMSWAVRVWDGYQWSPWSWAGSATSCYFSYDPTVPSAPGVSSADYPASNPEDPNDPWYDGVGRYGAFTVTAGSSDVNRYWVGVNTTPTSTGEYRPATPGGAVTVRVAPTKAGVNFLYVKALDAAGNVSAPATYMFRVSVGSAPRALWRLDEPAGSSTLAATVRDGTTAVTAAPVGGATLGVDGQVGTALRGDGTSGYAETAAGVVDSSQSYAVSAWARLANVNAFAGVVSQEGSAVSAFNLQYVKSANRWAFSVSSSDSVAGVGAVAAKSTAAPTVGEWTHLVGVYDAVAKTATLYVNGAPQESKPVTTAWNATGPLAIGRAKYNGAKVDFFPGEIDDVRAYDRIVTADEVADLVAQHPVVAGRWKLNTDGADDSGRGRPVILYGDARVDQSAGWLGSPMGAVVLDGSGDYAATSSAVLDTGRSFTIAGWVTAASRPGAKASVFSQEGAVNSGFILRYNPAGAGGWQVELPAADTGGATAQTAAHSAYQWQLNWDHVALTYDSLADVLSLYVNGQLEQTEANVSVRWNTVSFAATRPLQLGRSKSGGTWGEYWPGVIDDVWAFSGVLSQEQVQALAGYTEIPSDSPF